MAAADSIWDAEPQPRMRQPLVEVVLLDSSTNPMTAGLGTGFAKRGCAWETRSGLADLGSKVRT